MIAWDPQRASGVVTMDDMPPPPPGHDYQLWVLDPSKKAPVSAGVVTDAASFAQHFVADQVHMRGRPGFALSRWNRPGVGPLRRPARFFLLSHPAYRR